MTRRTLQWWWGKTQAGQRKMNHGLSRRVRLEMEVLESRLAPAVIAAPSDVTRPGDPIVPTSNNSPGSEGVANAIDDQPTKYLNFDRLNAGFTVTPSVGPTRVTGITLTSANDAPERDPASFQLQGSLDGVFFTPIASGSVPAFSSRFFKNFLSFSNDQAYANYRLIFPTVVGPGGNSMQIAEVELLGVAAPLPRDITQPGDPIVPTSNNSPGSEGVANAIDNQPTKYLNFDRLNAGFTVSPRAGLTIVSGLTLTSAEDAPERDPATYILSGSYDGQNFTPISSGSVGSFPSRFFKNSIVFNNTVPYLHYRLIFPAVAGPGGNSMQIAEVELLGLHIAPPAPQLLVPANNSNVAIDTPLFDWTDVTDPLGDPISYYLQVDDDPAFNSPEIDRSGLTGSTFTPAAGLSAGAHFWRVQTRACCQ